MPGFSSMPRQREPNVVSENACPEKRDSSEFHDVNSIQNFEVKSCRFLRRSRRTGKALTFSVKHKPLPSFTRLKIFTLAVSKPMSIHHGRLNDQVGFEPSVRRALPGNQKEMKFPKVHIA